MKNDNRFKKALKEKLHSFASRSLTDGKPYQITSITNEAFDTLTRGIEPTGYASVEFYTIEKHEVGK